ncbi:MAG TPA: lipopolysaccharide biosynthesis protein [Terriglobales bacterium]
MAWTGAAKWGTQGVSWVSTVIVARLLTPGDFGLVNMATVYLGFLTLVSEFGVGAAVVSLRDLDDDQIAQLNTFSILLGISCFVLSCAAAVPLGLFFKAPQLPLALAVMSVSFLINAFQSVPMALLQKEMCFKLLSIIDAVRAIFLAGVTIALAFAGFGYWTLIYGSLVSAAIATGLTVLRRPHRFAGLRGDSLKHALAFSWRVLVSRLAWYGYSNSDFVVAGKTLGQAALGGYSLAWNIATMPVEKITAMIGGVTPAFFSSIQKDRAALQKYFLNITEGIALLTFPAAFGLALVAGPFVTVLLGPKWLSVIVPLELLSLYVSVRSLAPILPQILTVTGGTRFGMWSSLLNLVLFPPAFYIGSRWGATGIAVAWILVYPIANIPLYWRVFKTLDLGFGAYLKVLRPTAFACAIMSAGVLLERRYLPEHWPAIWNLALLVLTGALLYVASIWLFFRDRIIAIYRRLRPSQD